MTTPSAQGFGQRALWVSAVARGELRRQLLGSVNLILMASLVVQTCIYALNSEYMAQIGASDVPRNSPYVIYHFTSDNGFWLIFFLAHIMTSAVVDDLKHRFAEVAYTFPCGPRTYLFGKYLGALASGLVVAASVSISWVLVPMAMRHLAGRADLFMPTPWSAVAHAYALFLVPSVFGFGTLYFAAAVRSGRSAPAYALSFLVMAVWMVGILVLWRGGVDREAGEWLDPIGYNSVAAQLSYWTAEERIRGTMSLTGPFLANRLGVMGIGALALVAAFARPSAERLLVGYQRGEAGGSRGVWGRGQATRSPGHPSCAQTSSEAPALPRHEAKARFDTRAQGRAVALVAWQLLAESLRARGTRMVLLFGLILMVASAMFQLDGGADGPQLPWAGLVGLRLVEFFYMPTAIFLCSSAGSWVTRERDAGFSQIQDALPAPTWVIALPRALALAGLALALALAPTLSLLLVELAIDRATFAPREGMFFALAVIWPANLQVAALALFFYSVVSRRALAHFLAFSAVFLCVMNHSLSVVSQTALQYAMPIHVFYSPLTGLAPWITQAIWVNGWLLSVAAAIVFAAVLWWPRGTELAFRARLQRALRERSSGQMMVLGGIVAVGALCGLRVYRAVNIENRYRSPGEERAEAASYEATYVGVAAAPRPRVMEGKLEVELRPAEREARIAYELTLENGGSRPIEALDFDVPEKLSLAAIDAEDRTIASWDRDDRLRHHRITLGRPLESGETVRVTWRGAAAWPSFANEGKPHPMSSEGAWLQDRDLLPRLGYDRRRELRAEGYRRELGLPARRPLPSAPDAASFQQAYGLESTAFPLAVTVRAPDALELVVSGAAEGHGQVEGRVSGSERLAIVAGRYARTSGTFGGAEGEVSVDVYHHPERVSVARAFCDAAVRSLGALSARYGDYGRPRVRIVEVPREIKATGLFGDVLLLSEEDGWDDAPENPGVLFATARHLSKRWWIDRLHPALVAGYATLGEGLPVLSGLVTVDAVLGRETRRAISDRIGEKVLRSIAEAREPVVPLMEADAGAYVPLYAGLAMQRLRDELGPDAFDGALRQHLGVQGGRGAPGASLASLASTWEALPGAGSAAQGLRTVESWAVRALSADGVPGEDGRWNISLDLAFTPYTFEGHAWRPSVAPASAQAPMTLALLDDAGNELSRVLATRSPGADRVTFTSERRPAAVVVDPDRVLLDRSPQQDRAAIRRAGVRWTR
ncbi:hypothetical protein WMF20_22410 [Sorangium sp. So ce834]|uniref:ABC transporter permease/M1 family aminopeptidase n=1 Tax=Sorangium sp. So ce834 TaxID=3133321 RepID=UPI003F5DD526